MPQINKNISLGNLIQIALIIVGFTAFTIRSEGRINLVESNHQNLEKRFDDQKDDIKHRLDRIEEKLDKYIQFNVGRNQSFRSQPSL